jgi:hypothetical protein
MDLYGKLTNFNSPLSSCKEFTDIKSKEYKYSEKYGVWTENYWVNYLKCLKESYQKNVKKKIEKKNRTVKAHNLRNYDNAANYNQSHSNLINKQNKQSFNSQFDTGLIGIRSDCNTFCTNSCPPPCHNPRIKGFLNCGHTEACKKK